MSIVIIIRKIHRKSLDQMTDMRSLISDLHHLILRSEIRMIRLIVTIKMHSLPSVLSISLKKNLVMPIQIIVRALSVVLLTESIYSSGLLLYSVGSGVSSLQKFLQDHVARRRYLSDLMALFPVVVRALEDIFSQMRHRLAHFLQYDVRVNR